MTNEIRFVLEQVEENRFGGNVWSLTRSEKTTIVELWRECDLTEHEALDWADLVVFRQLKLHPDACPSFIRESRAHRWTAVVHQ